MHMRIEQLYICILYVISITSNYLTNENIKMSGIGIVRLSTRTVTVLYCTRTCQHSTLYVYEYSVAIVIHIYLNGT